MGPNIKYGTVTGTGSAINVSIGFEPVFVLIGNITDNDQIDIWFSGLSATGLQINTAVAARSSVGVSLYAGSSTAAKGFTIGSGISESGDTLAYLAIGAGPGEA